MIPCLKDKVLHGVKVIDGVMMEMIEAIMPVIPKIDINPMQRFVFDPSCPFTLNYLKKHKHSHPTLVFNPIYQAVNSCTTAK